MTVVHSLISFVTDNFENVDTTYVWSIHTMAIGLEMVNIFLLPYYPELETMVLYAKQPFSRLLRIQTDKTMVLLIEVNALWKVRAFLQNPAFSAFQNKTMVLYIEDKTMVLSSG